MHCLPPPASFHLPQTERHWSFRPAGVSFLRIAAGFHARLDARNTASYSGKMTGVPEILTNASKVIASLFKRLTTSPRLSTLISKKLTRNAKRMTIPPKGMTAIFQRLAIIPGMQVTFSKMLTSNPKMMTSGFHEMTNNSKMMTSFP